MVGVVEWLAPVRRQLVLENVDDRDAAYLQLFLQIGLAVGEEQHRRGDLGLLAGEPEGCVRPELVDSVGVGQLQRTVQQPRNTTVDRAGPAGVE